MNALVIDAEAVKEFLDKADQFLTSEMMHQWDSQMMDRRQRISALLAAPSDKLQRSLPDLCRLVPSTARLKDDDLRVWIPQLLNILRLTMEDPGQVVSYVQTQDPYPGWLLEWATFWGFVIDPIQWPWWSRWLYTPKSRTGSLALVVMDPDQLGGEVPELYRKLAMGVTFYRSVLDSNRRLHEVSETYRGWIGLAATYAVYMFTMASWRLTNEFTQVMPPFPNVVQSLLGIHRWEGSVFAKG